MFKQNPHPLYLSLLDHDYSLVPVINRRDDDTKLFRMTSNSNKIIVSVTRNVLKLSCAKTNSLTSFTHHSFYKNPSFHINTIEKVEDILQSFVKIIRKSLNPKNIHCMNLVLSVIAQRYPDIEGVFFDSHMNTNKQSISFGCDSFLTYEITGQDIYDLIYDFYFINNLSLKDSVSIVRTSNHAMLENLTKLKELKKLLKINPKVKMLK